MNESFYKNVNQLIQRTIKSFIIISLSEKTMFFGMKDPSSTFGAPTHIPDRDPLYWRHYGGLITAAAARNLMLGAQLKQPTLHLEKH